ncbi:polypyrimidine tract-binding protein homolog 2 isoform X1 [Tanacetum coccineum]
MVVPILNGEGHTMERMVVEYEWTPPCYSDCHVFGHNTHECPKRVVEHVNEMIEAQTDGFTNVRNRKKKGKKVVTEQPHHIELSDEDDVFFVQDVGESSSCQKDESELGNSEQDAQDSKSKGLNRTSKQSEACSKVFSAWEWTSNASLCNKGYYIITGWNKDMVDVVHKMKSLKKHFRKLLHEQGNLHDRVNHLRTELDEVQEALDLDPSNFLLRDKEAVYVQAFNDAKIDEERTNMACDELDYEGLFHKKVFELSNETMTRPVTNEEIKRVMFGIGDDKAPSPDGFTSVFFKKGWDVARQDVCHAVRDFFELMHNYHRDRGPPRYAFKVDIQKAYDMVDWCFLGYILKCFGFPEIMIKWIMACVTSTSFSLSINGSIYGFFKGKHGLQQGNPLSSYLFTLVMEILTLILQRRVRMSDDFRYHKHCEELNIINVCFADDLFLFARGYVESSKVIMDSLNEFK